MDTVRSHAAVLVNRDLYPNPLGQDLIREQSNRQTVLDYYLPCDGKLDPDNLWVRPAEEIPPFQFH